MLHLQARVHFQEVEIAIAVHQKFHRAGICVAGGACDFQRGLAHASRSSGCCSITGDGHSSITFLMTPLDGAFALAQVNHVAVMVAQHLNFDVPRLHHQLFDVDFVVLKGAQRFARCVANGRFQILLAIDAPHSLAAAARRRL